MRPISKQQINQILLIFVVVVGLGRFDQLEVPGDVVTTCGSSAQSIYKYNMTLLEGDTVPLIKFKSMVVLIVNVASFCRYTPQYLQLNELMKKYGNVSPNLTQDSDPLEMVLKNSKDNQPYNKNACKLQILGFPSNLFKRKEPGYDFEIKNCLYYVRPGKKFVPAFPLSTKINVNGDLQIPLYTYLKNVCHTNSNLANETCSLWSPIRNNDITWNFEKFLIDHHGHPVYRFQPKLEPILMSNHIELLIKNCHDEIYKNKLFGTLDLNHTIYAQYMKPKQPINTNNDGYSKTYKNKRNV